MLQIDSILLKKVQSTLALWSTLCSHAFDLNSEFDRKGLYIAYIEREGFFPYLTVIGSLTTKWSDHKVGVDCICIYAVDYLPHHFFICKSMWEAM